MKKMISAIVCIQLLACHNQANKNNVQGEWIKGTEQEQLKTIEKHFRGFDNTMVEVGYRYQELYWGGQDNNWEYAKYQLEKIKYALENGIQRRPKRANSATPFLKTAIPDMQRFIETKNIIEFNKGITLLTAQCNNCHSMEKVPHFTVNFPLQRLSPIHPPK
jgi:hypothetical protein